MNYWMQKTKCLKLIKLYIYIYIYIKQVKLRENPIVFQIGIQLESNFVSLVSSNLNF